MGINEALFYGLGVLGRHGRHSETGDVIATFVFSFLFILSRFLLRGLGVDSQTLTQSLGPSDSCHLIDSSS